MTAINDHPSYIELLDRVKRAEAVVSHREIVADYLARFDELEGLLSVLWAGVVCPLVERIDRLEEQIRGNGCSAGLPYSFEDLKLFALRRALHRTGGNKVAASRLLQINIRTLYIWLNGGAKKAETVNGN